MPSLELSSGTIEYQDTGGDGPVIVPIHGLVMNGDLWRDVVADLRTDHRCVVPTLPLGGHRVPMRADTDLSLHGQARLIGELLERLELEDVTLVANDWGGPQITAVEQPERIGALVLASCEAFDNIPPGLPGKFAALSGRLPGGLFIGAQSLRIRGLRRLPMTFGRMAKRPVPDDLMTAWIEGLRTNADVRRDVKKYITTSDLTGLTTAAEALRGFDRPALIVWSSEDLVMPPAHARRLADLLPDARLVEIADSYTLIPLDQPRELAQAIRTFIHSSVPGNSRQRQATAHQDGGSTHSRSPSAVPGGA